MFKQNADGAVDCLILTSSVSRQQAAAKVECPLIGCPLRTPPTDWWNKLILLDGIPIDVTLIRSLYLVSPAPNTAQTQPQTQPTYQSCVCWHHASNRFAKYTCAAASSKQRRICQGHLRSQTSRIPVWLQSCRRRHTYNTRDSTFCMYKNNVICQRSEHTRGQ